MCANVFRFIRCSIHQFLHSPFRIVLGLWSEICMWFLCKKSDPSICSEKLPIVHLFTLPPHQCELLCSFCLSQSITQYMYFLTEARSKNNEWHPPLTYVHNQKPERSILGIIGVTISKWPIDLKPFGSFYVLLFTTPFFCPLCGE